MRWVTANHAICHRGTDEMDKMSALRTVLRAVEISLASSQGGKNDEIQLILEETEALRSRISAALYELDVLVHDKLQGASRRASPSSPTVAKFAWLRQQKQLERLRAKLRNMTGSLTAILTALNSVQLTTKDQSSTNAIGAHQCVLTNTPVNWVA
jgi:hypothetical protein